MNRLTDVVKHLLIINVIVFFALGMVFPLFAKYTYLYYPASTNFQPYQLVTSMFMHGSLSHLMFNMLSLYFLGPLIENNLGAKRFLILYLVAGFAANFLHILMAYLGVIPPVPVVGASGAIMGVFVAIYVLYPNIELMLLIPPIPIKAKYLVPILVGIDLFSGVSQLNTGIAHFAHIGGVIAGFILVTYWHKNRYTK